MASSSVHEVLAGKNIVSIKFKESDMVSQEAALDKLDATFIEGCAPNVERVHLVSFASGHWTKR